MDDIRAMFLRQSMLDCEENFEETITRRDTPSWDWLVITAANEAQASAYRQQIDRRLSKGRLPRQTRYIVIPDPDGKRVGNGGATLNVLREIARLENSDEPFAMKKILVLHSGGDSQRIPQYSACGKLFAHVPRALRSGRASTLFDEFCISLSCVPSRMHSGMLILSGDVLLLFNALQVDLERKGAACLSIKAPVETGTRHGVFVSDQDGYVSHFLHKKDEKTLRMLDAVNAQDMVDIDTGAIWMDESLVDSLYGLIKQDQQRFDRFVNEHVRLSFYGDFVYPMSSGSTLESYLAQSPENTLSTELLNCRREIWEAIGNTRLSMIRLAPAEFIHFGSTKEWRDLMLNGETRYGFLNWRRSVSSFGASKRYAAINSIIHPDARIESNCVIEDSRIGPHAVLLEGSILSGADFDSTLPANAVLHVLPIDSAKAYCARIYGAEDNPKDAKHFGQPIDELLWTAPIHPVMGTSLAAAEAAINRPQSAHAQKSLQDGFASADLKSILIWQDQLTEDVKLRQILAALESGAPVAEILPMLSLDKTPLHQKDMLLSYAQSACFPLQHRIYYLLAKAARPDVEGEMENACWQSINSHMLSFARKESGSLPPPQIVRDRVDISLPVRVNWGGGWSDTPPYCLEHGGTVLNASVLLGGKRPVRAIVERLNEPVVRIISDDLGISREYTEIMQLSPGNPSDPHALCKAALYVCGIIPFEPSGSLRDILKALGCGIQLRTAVENVPKGSGLGTSSILSAAVARALAQFSGQPDDDARIATLSLCMEQLMNTGGGWQDQIGGLFSGVKLTSSRPGTPQVLASRPVLMPDKAFEELSERHALVYTGQRRLARNILRDIMGKVIAGHPETMEILSKIQRLAVLMAYELETGDIDQFCQLLREHWDLSKRLDAGSSNTCIDHMLAVSDDLISGAMICGAGGGGFMSMMLKSGVSRQALSSRFDHVYQESGVKVWAAELER